MSKAQNIANAPAGRDTIRILVATDNHVGYNERDPIRGEDSAKTFDEIMRLAKQRTVDMVLLAGDLFHENKPSRKSLNSVMRSLRLNCFGDKPCELEMLSDPTEHFDATFDHVNYEDPDINVSIPVFSIHGNHDDPSGEGHLAALDLLQTCGLINYYGRTPESDNILVKPVLLQKGRTKLALYGMSNVRDERLYRTFRDGKVKFFRPNAQKDNWFNLMSVHQNHHAYTETSYLPENFLPEFLNLVVWGHEHECITTPKYNPEMSFDVMQPGSSVATSLMPGEAAAKHIMVLEITGQKYKCEAVRLKTVRPFVMKEIFLQEEKGMKSVAKKDNNRPDITRHLMSIVQELIEEAKRDWDDMRSTDSIDEEDKMPLPLVRLRVEYSAPEGGKYDCENPQRFSNRFDKKVANTNDVVQFYKKKGSTSRRTENFIEIPEESSLVQLTIDTVKVEKLVREFLNVQPLTVLPGNLFGDAVSQFVDKDDKHAMEMFVDDTLTKSIHHLVGLEDANESDVLERMGEYRTTLEELFAAGHGKRAESSRLKPRPAHWDSDLDGDWADQPGALELSDGDAEQEEHSEEDSGLPRTAVAKTRLDTASRGSRSIKPSQRAAPRRKNITTNNDRTGKTARKVYAEQDVVMIDEDEDENVREEEISQERRAKKRNVQSKDTDIAKSSVSSSKNQLVRATRAPARQSKLRFSRPVSQAFATGASKIQHELSDDEISDDDDGDDNDDAFEPNIGTKPSKARRSRD